MGLPAFIAMTGLVLELGHLYFEQADLENEAEAIVRSFGKEVATNKTDDTKTFKSYIKNFSEISKEGRVQKTIPDGETDLSKLTTVTVDGVDIKAKLSEINEEIKKHDKTAKDITLDTSNIYTKTDGDTYYYWFTFKKAVDIWFAGYFGADDTRAATVVAMVTTTDSTTTPPSDGGKTSPGTTFINSSSGNYDDVKKSVEDNAPSTSPPTTEEIKEEQKTVVKESNFVKPLLNSLNGKIPSNLSTLQKMKKIDAITLLQTSPSTQLAELAKNETISDDSGNDLNWWSNYLSEKFLNYMTDNLGDRTQTVINKYTIEIKYHDTDNNEGTLKLDVRYTDTNSYSKTNRDKVNKDVSDVIKTLTEVNDAKIAEKFNIVSPSSGVSIFDISETSYTNDKPLLLRTTADEPLEVNMSSLGNSENPLYIRSESTNAVTINMNESNYDMSTNTGRPFVFIYEGSREITLNIGEGKTFYGTIYAPNAKVILKGEGSNVYKSSIVSDSVDTDNFKNGKYYED